jgi:hypothetical protein
MSSKLLGALGALLLLAGCQDTNRVGQDGYTFESIDMPNTGKKITFVLYKSDHHFRYEVKRRNLVPDRLVFGFSIINQEKNTCEVHIVDPAVRYDPEAVGHEITHCLYGNFHKSQA